MTGSGLVKFGVGGVVGLAVGYLCDPNRGRARRAQLRDRGRAAIRREARAVAKRAHYERGRIEGVRHRARGDQRPVVDDRMLVDRVRSEVLGHMPELAHCISIDAYGRDVTLRGELGTTTDIERVVDAVNRTDGVDRVVNLLHLPGEVPANKADAMQAGR